MGSHGVWVPGPLEQPEPSAVSSEMISVIRAAEVFVQLDELTGPRTRAKGLFGLYTVVFWLYTVNMQSIYPLPNVLYRIKSQGAPVIPRGMSIYYMMLRKGVSMSNT